MEVEWDAAVCKCGVYRKGDPEGSKTCFPTIAADEWGVVHRYETPTDTLPPWSTSAATVYSYGFPLEDGSKALAATYVDCIVHYR